MSGGRVALPEAEDGGKIEWLMPIRGRTDHEMCLEMQESQETFNIMAAERLSEHMILVINHLSTASYRRILQFARDRFRRNPRASALTVVHNLKEVRTPEALIQIDQEVQAVFDQTRHSQLTVAKLKQKGGLVTKLQSIKPGSPQDGAPTRASNICHLFLVRNVGWGIPHNERNIAALRSMLIESSSTATEQRRRDWSECEPIRQALESLYKETLLVDGLALEKIEPNKDVELQLQVGASDNDDAVAADAATASEAHADSLQAKKAATLSQQGYKSSSKGASAPS
eukprot:TRINITY_DN9739_c0_g1_i1.p1 TRINITY_DN9739_c0_g1~~TRINITY_DN9739_c0_g1_i1.p1  ORF type:complete len:285 (+),score=65.73 TRINITY_DN9739_c0_g1_i1:879-1733(+)